MSVFALVCTIYLFFFTIYSQRRTSINGLQSLIKGKFATADELLASLETKFKSLNVFFDYNKYWKYYTGLHDYNLQLDPDDYKKVRKSKLYYDPRITFAVYIHHIRKLLESRSENQKDPVAIPFSWQDWVDLSYLNQFLQYDEVEKPNCYDIFSHGLEYKPALKGRPTKTKAKQKKIKEFDKQPCVDNSEYKGKVPKALLPGFNVQGHTFTTFFLEKKVHAKSYVLSSFPPPNCIVFLSKDGTYSAVPDTDKNMIDSGIFDDYIKDSSKAHSEHFGNKKRTVLVDPVDEYDQLQAHTDAQKGKRDFNRLFSAENNYEYVEPLDDFYYDYPRIVQELRAKRDVLSPHEKRHLESLEYSLSLDASSLPKAFQEVNIIWPESHNGHRVKENGAHYDWRFFDGFVSESKANAYDDTNEKRKLILHRMVHTWLQFTFRTGIFSVIAHGSLLSWWWDGLVFEWDDDIDVQMPIMELDRFCAAYNGSMIVEDVSQGFSKYYVDCSTSITHRAHANGLNNIDARFIDVDSGMYIDITGLAITGSPGMPIRFHEQWKDLREHPDKIPDPGFTFPDDAWNRIVKEEDKKKDEAQKQNNEPKSSEKNGDPSLRKRLVHRSQGRADQRRRNAMLLAKTKARKTQKELNIYFDRNAKMHLFNCRNNHFYSYEEMMPLQLSSMEGASALVPRDYEGVIKFEYSRGLLRKSFQRYVYSEDLRFWIPLSKIRSLLRTEAKTSIQSRLIKFMFSHRLQALSRLLEDDEILKEFFLTHKATHDHLDELKLRSKRSMNKMTDDDKREYSKLMDHYKEYQKPMRKDYHNYMAEVEYLERHGITQ